MADPTNLLNETNADPLNLFPNSSAPNPDPKPIPVSEADSFGGKVASVEARKDQAAYDTGFIDTLGASFNSGDNFAVQVYKRIEREVIAPPPDPNFDVEAYIKSKHGLIPQHLENKVRLADSQGEADLVVADMLEELQDQDMLSRRGGFSTFVAQGLSGIVDLDTPFTLGAGAGFKGGMLATRWGRMAAGGMQGAAAQVAGSTVAFEAGTTGDWTSIPTAGLAGLAFGGAFGAISKAPRVTVHPSPEDAANASIHAAAKEFDEFVAEGGKMEARDIRAERHTHEDVYQTSKIADDELVAENAPVAEGASRAPQVFKWEDLELRPDSIGENNIGASVGARQLNAQGSTASITNKRSADIQTAAQQWASQSGIPGEYFAKTSPLATKGAAGDFVAKQASRFHDAVVATGLATDFDRLFRSGSAIAQKLAYDTGESASGIVRNNRSAAALKDHHEKKLLGAFLPAYEDAYKLHSKSNKVSKYDQWTDSSLRNKFNEEVFLELQARAYDTPGTPRSLSPGVKEAADAMDRWSALEIELGKGRAGETPIKGYEKLTAYSGYTPQRWSSKKMEDLIRSGKTEKDIIDAVAEAYKRMHGGMTKADALVYAGSVVKRSRSMGRGVDTNLIGMLQQDGRDFVEDMLRRNGVSANDAAKLIDRLTGLAAERGQAGHTKGRIDVDMRTQASNGIRLLDLFDTDLVDIISRRSRGSAGAAALARKGIASRTDRLDIIQGILDEQAAKGPSQRTGVTPGERLADAIDEDKHLTREDIEHYFSYFDGGPVAGGLDPLYANMKKLTNLALLNGLGLTQIGETGAMVASVGVSRWWQHAGAALRASASDPKSALVQELKHMDVLVPEERLFRPDLNIEMDRVGTAQSELAMKISKGLNLGQRVQGYVSGFYGVRNIQQRIAVTSAADKIMTNMKGIANDLSAARAADIGLDPATFARVKSYVDNGTVEFKDGSLHKLNFDKWRPEDVEDFSLSLNRHVNQVVQKTMVGEDNILFHRDGIINLFVHLKSFPLLAMEKQALRNLRIGDQEAMTTFLYGLATAGTVYTAKQALAGRTDNLEASDIAKGAFGMSNMAGWIPMWTDPLAGMLGLDSLKFNEYSRGIDNNIVSAPAAFTTMNRMANIPGAVGNVLTGDYTNNDVRALQTTPIIGNLYGFTYMFNAMKN